MKLIICPLNVAGGAAAEGGCLQDQGPDNTERFPHSAHGSSGEHLRLRSSSPKAPATRQRSSVRGPHARQYRTVRGNRTSSCSASLSRSTNCCGCELPPAADRIAAESSSRIRYDPGERDLIVPRGRMLSGPLQTEIFRFAFDGTEICIGSALRPSASPECACCISGIAERR